MHEVLVNRLGGLSLPRKSVVRLTDRPNMTSDVYRGRKTTIQQQQQRFVTYKSVSAITQKTNEGNFIKLHRKIKQNKKVCCAQNLGSHYQGQGYNQRSKVCYLQIVCQA